MNTSYGFGKSVALQFDAALVRVTDELQKEGFGVLSDIDVQATMKRKIGVDFPPYRILGACNPSLAHAALVAEPGVGLLLPCNVVVRQDEAARVQVEFMNPEAVLALIGRSEISGVAAEVRTRLERVMAALP